MQATEETRAKMCPNKVCGLENSNGIRRPRYIEAMISLFFLLFLLIFCFSIDGVYNARVRLPSTQSNPCTMTYMWPNYYPIPVVNESDLSYRYRAYQYSHHPLQHNEKLYKSSSVVLFLPGNAGNYSQVRSIGKETIERVMSIHPRMRRSEIAIYALDFRGEMSAWSGVFLDRQAKFVTDMLRYIYRVHSAGGKPVKIVIVGHSMGGIVARYVLSKIDRPENTGIDKATAESVLALLTLATPHKSPIIGSDIFMARIYRKISQHVDSSRVYFSLAGGYRDIMIASSLSELNEDQYKLALTAATTSTHGMPVAHEVILWCNEVVASISEEIIDILMEGYSHRRYKQLVSPLSPLMRMKSFIPKNSKENFQRYMSRFQTYRIRTADSIEHVQSFFTDIVVRNYMPYMFQHGFFVAMILFTLMSNASMLEVVSYLAIGTGIFFIGADTDDKKLILVPAILMVNGLVLLLGATVLTKTVFFVRKFVSHIQVIGLVGTVAAVLYRFSFSPWPSHCLAASLIYTGGVLVVNLVAVMSSIPLGDIVNLILGKRIEAMQLEPFFGLAYFPALIAWSSPVILSWSLLELPLGLFDIYPNVEHRGSGVTHMLSPPKRIRDTDFYKSYRLGRDTNWAKISERLFFEGRIDTVLSFGEVVFLVSSLLTMLPIIYHLYLIRTRPLYSSPEVVLDSRYERVRKAKSMDVVPKVETIKPGTTIKPKATAVVEATIDSRGAVLFNDTEYVLDNTPLIVVFANGEEIQLDALESMDPLVEKLPDAVPLIDDKPDHRSHLEVVLIERVRTAGRAIHLDELFRVMACSITLFSLQGGAEFMFSLQYGACLMALLALFFRLRNSPTEHYRCDKVA